MTDFDRDTIEVEFELEMNQTELQIPGNVTLISVCSVHRCCTAGINNTIVKVSRLHRKRYL